MKPLARSCRAGRGSLAPGEETAWTFFGAFDPDHSAASSDEDLARIDDAESGAVRVCAS